MNVFSKRASCTTALTAAISAGLLVASSANAGLVSPPLQLTWSVDGGAPATWTPIGTPDGSGGYNYQGAVSDPNGFWAVSYNLVADNDPTSDNGNIIVTGNVVVQNLTTLPAGYSFGILLPVANAITPSSVIGGSAAFGLTTDSGGGSLTTTGNTPMWQAQIDNTTVHSLFNAPFSLVNSGLGSSNASENFGTPIPSLGGPAVLNSIGILINFTLSGLDQASVTSTFVVAPAPGALALLGLAGFAGTRRRRA